jgi:RHS repeat-associated protein
MSVGDSGAGNFTATPWNPSNDWHAGTSSGAFTYDYDVPVPPAVAGAAPQVQLSYSSSSVDGMNISSNNQASWAGLGWDYQPGYIERLYVPCNTDGENAAWADKCWKAPSGEATWQGAYQLSFAGHSGVLVPTTVASVYRLEDNPGWLIQRRTGAPSGGNADNDGEYWVIITNEGVRYTFGYGTEPTSNAQTKSTWTVPVMGNNSGEACYNAVKAASFCRQAWRWNLDRVEDTNLNVTSYFYTTETNYYAEMGTATLVNSYDRAGYLDRIEYGKRSGFENQAAAAKVLFTSVYRCQTGTNSADPLNTPNGSCAAPTPTGTDYPDAPLDQMCTSSTNCSGHYAPTFFQTKRLDKIYTQYLNSAGNFNNVALTQLKFSFPSNTDGTSPSLFLEFVQRRGMVGTAVTEPIVRFWGLRLNNRVDWTASVPAMKKYRVSAITNELGGHLMVEYGEEAADTCPQNGSAGSDWSAWYAQVNGHWDTNHFDCYPSLFDPDGAGGQSAGFGIFHKYLATAVTMRDLSGADSPDMRTEYTYGGGAGWRKESPQITGQPSLTWDDYRGYSTVTIDRGVVGTAHDAREVNTYFRGMDGDVYANGTSKSFTLTDYDGNVFTDGVYLTGNQLQSRTQNGTGSELTATRNQFWVGMGVTGPGIHDSHAVRVSLTKTRDWLSTATWRYHLKQYTYDATLGVQTQAIDSGDTSTSTDDRCATTDYNTTRTTPSQTTTYWMIDYPDNQVLRSGSCTTGTVLRHVATLYDASASLGGTLYRGTPTAKLSYKDLSSYLRTEAAYDQLGRPVTSTTALGHLTTTSYNPATGWPFSGITTTRTHQNSTNFGGGTGTVTLSTTATLSPAFGSPLTSTDENGQTSYLSYDAIGRLTSVHRPNDRADGAASQVFSYLPDTVSTPIYWQAPSRTLSQTMYNENPDWLTGYVYTDGWGRTRQSQAISPYTGGGTTFRILTETTYDERGLVNDASGPMSNQAAAGSGMVTLAEASMTSYTKTSYDALARPLSQTLYGGTTAKAETDMYYYGDATLVTPPVGPPTKTSYDVFGQTTAVRTSAAGGWIEADYSYNNAGDLTGIVQNPSSTMTPASLTWSNAYDLLGRRTSASDPDTGTSTTSYDADSNVTDVTPPTPGVAVHTNYDDLNRPISTTTATGSKVWNSSTYDTATLGKGKPAAAASYPGSAPGSLIPTVTHTATSYDGRGRLTSDNWAFPDPRTNATITAAYGYTYDYADRPLTQTITKPTGITDSGLLDTETITQAYQGQANNGAAGDTTTSALPTNRPLASPSYNTIGAIVQLGVGEQAGTVGTTPGATQRYYYYDQVTYQPTRLSTGSSTGVVSDTSFEYDLAGTPTKIIDTTNGQNECFTYDGYYRLRHAWTQTASDCTAGDSSNTGTGTLLPYSRRYVYDLYNRRTSATIDDPATGGTVITSNYANPTTHPNAVTSATTAPNLPALNATYTVDGLGRQATRTIGGAALQNLGWNEIGQLSTFGPTPAESYTYGADGSRFSRTTAAGTTVYLPGTELTFTPGPAGTLSTTRYYTAAGKTLGYRSNASTSLYWLQTTRAGTNDLAIKDDDGAIGRRRHLPFGESLGSNTGFTAHGFLNKPEDATGLDQIGARYYDAQVGTFISPDPLLAVASPMGMNAYTYAAGNPVAYSDPTGLCLADPDLANKCDRLATNAAQTAQTNNALSHDNTSREEDLDANVAYSATGNELPSKYIRSDWSHDELVLITGARCAGVRGGPNGYGCTLSTEDVNSWFQGDHHERGNVPPAIDFLLNVAFGAIIGPGPRLGDEAQAAILRFAARTAELDSSSSAARVLINQTAGNAFRDATAARLEREGWTVLTTEFTLTTPLGVRVVDILAEREGTIVGFETKLGGSRYLPSQRAKDRWIMELGGRDSRGDTWTFPTILIRG